MPVAVTFVRSPNHFNGRNGHSAVAIVLHTMGGTLAGCDSWFMNPASQVSAHYGVGFFGTVHQYVNLEDGSWRNGALETGNTWPGPVGVNPNYVTVSIETEDQNNANLPVSQAQYDATAHCCALALAKYPGIRHLVGHSSISPRTRAQCPGRRWTDSGLFDRLALQFGLAAQR